MPQYHCKYCSAVYETLQRKCDECGAPLTNSALDNTLQALKLENETLTNLFENEVVSKLRKLSRFRYFSVIYLFLLIGASWLFFDKLSLSNPSTSANLSNVEMTETYRERAHFVNRLAALQGIKIDISMYFSDHGVFPKSTQEFVNEYGKNIVQSNVFFEEISIDKNSKITALLASPFKEDEFLSLQPKVISDYSNSIQWNCETNVSQSKIGSSNICKSKI